MDQLHQDQQVTSGRASQRNSGSKNAPQEERRADRDALQQQTSEELPADLLPSSSAQEGAEAEPAPRPICEGILVEALTKRQKDKTTNYYFNSSDQNNKMTDIEHRF